MKKSKICRKCGKRKKNNQFNKQAASRDNLAAWCKKCYKGYNAAKYQANRVEFARKSLEKYYARKAKQNGSE